MAGLQHAESPPGPTRPDKISIWPISDEDFGLDATFRGPTGYKRAETIMRQLEGHSIKARLNQEVDQAWTVRFGPVTRDAMIEFLGGYVW